MYPPDPPQAFPDFVFWLVSESRNKVVGGEIGYGLSLQCQELGILLKVAPPFDKKLFFRVRPCRGQKVEKIRFWRSPRGGLIEKSITINEFNEINGNTKDLEAPAS